MQLLALNTVTPQNMRAKYQWAIGVLPITLMFAAFVPLIWFVSWLEVALGIPHNSAIKDQPNGALWFSIFLGTMVALMLLGYAIGWILNAAIARFLLGWSKSTVSAVFLRSEVPSHWLKAGIATQEDATLVSIAKWESQRKVGSVKFIIRRGIIAWGAPMFFAMYVIPTFTKRHPFLMDALVFQVLLWLAAGAAFGAFIWFISEANYRKLKNSQIGQ